MEKLPFDTEFWQGVQVPRTVVDSLRRFHDAHTADGERAAILASLFAAAAVEVRGVALDTFGQLRAQSRQGSSEALDLLARDAHACALRELRAPPHVRAEPDAEPRRGANHGSAFYAMSHSDDDEDALLVAKALRVNDDEHVLTFGLMALANVLAGRRDLPAPLVDTVTAIADDARRPTALRVAAIRATYQVETDAFDVWLLKRLEDPDRELAASAARSLVERDLDRYRDAVAALASAPADPGDPYDLIELRMQLAESA